MNLSPADIKKLGLVLDELDELITDVGPCEHPVNVCVCGLKSLRDDAADLFHRLSNGRVGTPLYQPTEANANNAAFRKGTIND